MLWCINKYIPWRYPRTELIVRNFQQIGCTQSENTHTPKVNPAKMKKKNVYLLDLMNSCIYFIRRSQAILKNYQILWKIVCFSFIKMILETWCGWIDASIQFYHRRYQGKLHSLLADLQAGSIGPSICKVSNHRPLLVTASTLRQLGSTAVFHASDRNTQKVMGKLHF